MADENMNNMDDALERFKEQKMELNENEDYENTATSRSRQ